MLTRISNNDNLLSNFINNTEKQLQWHTCMLTALGGNQPKKGEQPTGPFSSLTI